MVVVEEQEDGWPLPDHRLIEVAEEVVAMRCQAIMEGVFPRPHSSADAVEKA